MGSRPVPQAKIDQVVNYVKRQGTTTTGQIKAMFKLSTNTINTYLKSHPNIEFEHGYGGGKFRFGGNIWTYKDTDNEKVSS